MPKRDPEHRPLTRRECDVLQHAAFGLRNRLIGERLGIAEQTVKNHMASAMRKLVIHDRTQVVVHAISAGWIAIPVTDADGGGGDVTVKTITSVRLTDWLTDDSAVPRTPEPEVVPPG